MDESEQYIPAQTISLRRFLPRSPASLALFATVVFILHLAIEGAIVLFVLYVAGR